MILLEVQLLFNFPHLSKIQRANQCSSVGGTKSSLFTLLKRAKEAKH